MHTRPSQRRIALAVLAATAAILAANTPGAAAAPAANMAATSHCWLDVVNDWLNHQGTIQNTYPIPCYTQAIQNLNLYPDVRQYSNAIEDIQRALLAAIRQDRNNGPGASSGGGPSNSPGGTSGSSGPGGTSGGPGGSSGGILHALNPANAQSVPLPLLVLGILALLLLSAAGATWLTRRVQARRMPPPAPAHAPVVPKRR